jgi:pimeloyl-ACP methyl ester carboxylesterase
VRQALVIDARGRRLSGTYHVPADRKTPLGLLLLNGGPVPRSWNSGLPVELAEHLADLGMPVFRFDPPGLGDSPGPMPEYSEVYRRHAIDGGDDAALLALADALQERYTIERLFVGGLCLGGSLGVRLAASMSGSCCGVLLFEPDFRGPIPVVRVAAARAPAAEFRLTRSGLVSAARGALGRIAQYLGRGSLPAQAHAGLARCWREVAGRRIPTVFVQAEHGHGQWLARRLEAWLPRRAAGSVEQHLVLGTDHAFIEGSGRREARDLAVAWIARHAGLETCREKTLISSAPA